MSLITSDEAARRLARVILSDIELYNSEKIRAGLDLRREINEGYKLFRSRVAPELVSIFAAAVSQKRFGGNHVVFTPPAPPRPSVAPTGEQQPVDSVEAAKRLAATILLEVQSNTGRVADGAVLRFEIEEGRARFAARVSPLLGPVFDEQLAEMGLAQTRAPGVAMTGERSPAPPREPAADEKTPPAAPSWPQSIKTAPAAPSPSRQPAARAATPAPSPSWHQAVRAATPSPSWHQAVRSATPAPSWRPGAPALTPTPSWGPGAPAVTPAPSWRSAAPATTPSPSWQAAAVMTTPRPSPRDGIAVNPATRSPASWHQPAAIAPSAPARTTTNTGARAPYLPPVLMTETGTPGAVSLRVTPSPTIRLLTTLALIAAAATLIYLFLAP